MPDYDFAATVREEVAQLRRELALPTTMSAVQALAQRFGVTEGEALAVLWRASKRHGETLTVFAGELQGQFEREAAGTGAGTATGASQSAAALG